MTKTDVLEHRVGGRPGPVAGQAPLTARAARAQLIPEAFRDVDVDVDLSAVARGDEVAGPEVAEVRHQPLNACLSR